MSYLYTCTNHPRLDKFLFLHMYCITYTPIYHIGAFAPMDGANLLD